MSDKQAIALWIDERMWRRYLKSLLGAVYYFIILFTPWGGHWLSVKHVFSPATCKGLSVPVFQPMEITDMYEAYLHFFMK